jgi:hypothetical protein
MVNQVTVILESCVRGDELYMLFRQDTANKFLKESTSVELLSAALKYVLTLERVCKNDPR